VAEFLLEFYLSRLDDAAVEPRAVKARIAAEELTRRGTPVRYLRAIFIPEDETCLFLYEAASADTVRKAALRAGLSFERVAETLTDPKGAT
jgi:hypothetical protein